MKPHVLRRHTRLLTAALSLVLLSVWGLCPDASTAQPRATDDLSTQVLSQVEETIEAEAKLAVKKGQLERQLTELLEYDIANIRVQALQHIIYLSTNHGDDYDFALAVPRIMEIYESQADEAYRVMALVALHAIGDPGSMEHLQERVETEPSKRVRWLTQMVLKDYYKHVTVL